MKNYTRAKIIWAIDNYKLLPASLFVMSMYFTESLTALNIIVVIINMILLLLTLYIAFRHVLKARFRKANIYFLYIALLMFLKVSRFSLICNL